MRSGQEVVQGWEKRRLYVQAFPFVPESVCFPRRKKEEGGISPLSSLKDGMVIKFIGGGVTIER